MIHSSGWLLDVSIEQNRAIIWIKTIEGSILKLSDTYQPNFYVLPKDEFASAALFQILSQETIVKKVEWEQKFTDLFDAESRGLKRLISVYPDTVFSHNTLVKRLERDARVARLFNTDLSHIQRYLFSKLRIEPTSKVEVEYDECDSRLIKMIKMDEDSVAPPPFSILYFDLDSSLSWDSDSGSESNPITRIRARYQEEPDASFEGGEESILKDFHDNILDKDPDILVSIHWDYTHKSSNCFISRMNALGLDIGRQPSHNECWINGRVCLNVKSFHTELDLAGLIEKARFGFLPTSLASGYRMNRLIDSRNCYELIQKGFVIPSRGENKNHEPIRTLEDIYSKDKGGMIFSPKVGLHENVVVLDYENEYANLILKRNLSYETKPENEERGLLPTVLESVLRRRIFFKSVQQSLSVNGNEWKWCEQRINTLKSILVSLYGTSGSFWNRLSNVAAFEEINRLSREVLIKTKDIVQEKGFELLYADTDSVFMRKDGASLEDFEHIRNILARETGLPISLEHYYKFLVLLPLEASEKMEALKHYFGMTQSGELVARGIELRRHDAPNFIKEFQTELLYTLFDCKGSAEVISKGYENALLLITRTIDRLMTGEIKSQDLVVSKLLGQELDKYKSLFPHVSAAIQLAIEGKSTQVGEIVEYIFTNSGHTNPLHRVRHGALMEQNRDFDYDKEKYIELLLEAAETVLGYFGFNRTVYGGSPKRNKKWWHELVSRRAQDIENERS
jgi:DNA polymerase I